jgi:hypothetical protein
MLTAAQLGEYIDAHLTRSAFRLELLAAYDVASDGDDFDRYQRGEPGPSLDRKQPWLDRLTRERDAGIANQRVHVLSRPLTPYLRYECEWGYVPNAAAGEDIRIIDVTEQPAPGGLVDHDFWLVDDEYALRMYYDDQGRFLGARHAPPDLLGAYRHAKRVALAAAEPFGDWWTSHPEEWRRNAA